jgi:hypothetical protein
MMKRTIAAILTAILLFAAIPAAQAAGTDYTVRIPGGETSAYMTEIDGEDALRVDVYFDGVTDAKLLTALSFDLGFPSAKLMYVTDSQSLGVNSIYAVDASGRTVGDRSLIVNANNAAKGRLRFVLASDYGCRIRKDKPLISLYFYPMSGQTEGTTFTFSLTGEIEAESVRMSDQTGDADYTRRTVGADLTPYTLSESTVGEEIDAEIVFASGAVSYLGSMPYVIRTGKPQTPRVTVRNKETGKTVDSSYYRLSYQNNTEAGTAYVIAAFRNGYAGKVTRTFKIYLPATETTYAENVEDGVRLTWKAVTGARGYVIYRRAWNRQSAGWTSFERWNNTTRTTWVDTNVYAGTRYQYGVKAYPFDPMDNYNLGIVGPLKTTVRITTRTLEDVVPGRACISVRWSGSKNFTGYQIQYATDINFKENAKDIKISDPKTYETVLYGLSSRKVYYVRIRSYQVFEGMNYYGQWSNVLFTKTT